VREVLEKFYVIMLVTIGVKFKDYGCEVQKIVQIIWLRQASPG
jgi:hypothetical protein